MRRTLMKSKIHRATVTGADLSYVGSITLDPDLMALADMVDEPRIVHVDDRNRGVLEPQLG
jgi:aspartate 1-decarboxylase